MAQLTSYLNRVLFVLAFVIAGLAVLERIANLFDYTVLRSAYAPGRLLEFAAIAVLFVIALLLREIAHSLRSKGTA